jgi:hypothetical protein
MGGSSFAFQLGKACGMALHVALRHAMIACMRAATMYVDGIPQVQAVLYALRTHAVLPPFV